MKRAEANRANVDILNIGLGLIEYRGAKKTGGYYLIEETQKEKSAT